MSTARAPFSREDPIAKWIGWSSAVHAGLIVLFFIKEAVIPSAPKLIPPALRVDLVGLPDIVKKDLSTLTPPAPKETQAESKTAPPPLEVPDPDEMVLKPKEKVKDKPDPKERDKKLSNALARIRSLERLKAEEKANAAEEAVVIKGNQISKGSSLSGDARISLERSYYDDVRENLLANWTIPAWLTRQKYSAQVQITVDAQGMITGMRFMKPSGNEQFDAEVKNTLKASQPLPPPPEDLQDSLRSRGILVGFPL